MSPDADLGATMPTSELRVHGSRSGRCNEGTYSFSQHTARNLRAPRRRLLLTVIASDSHLTASCTRTERAAPNDGSVICDARARSAHLLGHTGVVGCSGESEAAVRWCRRVGRRVFGRPSCRDGQ